MATIAARLNGAKKVLEAMALQTLLPDEVHLYVSHEPYLLDTGIPSIPGNIIRLAQIHWVENAGPFRKLLPILKERWGEDVLIVTVDDDVQYPRWFLEKLVAGYKKGNHITCFMARQAEKDAKGLVTYPKWPKIGKPEDARVNRMLYPIGQMGILYPPGCFTKTIFDPKMLELSPSACEPWFWANALLTGAKTRVIGATFASMAPTGGRLWDKNKLTNDAALRKVLNFLEISI
jgi:hypothetical protein